MFARPLPRPCDTVLAMWYNIAMLVKELIGRLNSYNMDAEVSLKTTDDQDGELDFTIDDGQFIDNGNTTTVGIKIVPVPEVEPESL